MEAEEILHAFQLINASAEAQLFFLWREYSAKARTRQKLYVLFLDLKKDRRSGLMSMIEIHLPVT